MTRLPTARIGATALTLVAAIAMSACRGETATPPASHDLSEAWQAEPFAPAPAIVSQAELACKNLDVIPSTTPMVAMDARGANIVLIVLAGVGKEADCLEVRGLNGRFDAASTSSLSEFDAETVASTEVTVFSDAIATVGPNADSVAYAFGQAGTGIRVVELVTGAGVRVRASLSEHGWYAAWWPADEPDAQVSGYDAGGALVGSAP